MTTTLWRRWCSSGARMLNLSHTTSPARPLRRLCSPPPPDSPSWLFVLRRGISSSSYKLAADSGSNGVGLGGLGKGEAISMSEAKRLLRLVNVDSLKESLGMEGKEVIEYSELLRACESTGIARSRDEAVAFSRVLDDAGVILLFRDKVYLNPNKVVDLVRRAVPLSLMPEDDPVIAEFNKLQEKKEEIDVMAHKQVRRILWTGLGFAVAQVGLFFRLTFWEFSWDVMEPIAFFTSATSIVVCYAYFLITSRDPTYQDLMKRLFLSRQRALLKKHSIDLNRLKELQMRCSAPVDAATSIKNRVGVDVKLDDALHKD